MKKFKLFSLFCLGMAMATVSCSKDEEEVDNPYDTIIVTPIVPTPEDEGGNDDTPTVDNSSFRFYGAELYSKETFTYGRFEAKMKMAYAPGCISSMFLYYNNSHKGDGEIWNEIDIEVIGKQPNGFQSNLITGTAEKQITSEKVHNLGSPISSDFHVYVIEWTPTYVAWYMDGKEIKKTDASNDTKNQITAMVKDQSLRFNIWSSKSVSWVGKLNHEDIPITQEIDYIKVSDYDAATGTFVERWTDDFDSFDSNRWSKGNWAMENVTERTSNVVVEDGILKLKLTKEAKN